MLTSLSDKLDEILDELRNGGDLDDIEQAKAAILQAFKDKLPEVDSVSVTADEDVEEGYTRAIRHYEQSLAEGYNMAIRDIKDILEGKGE